MNKQNSLSLASKLTVAALIAATIGVVIQIISGHPYPTIPPVFFIQLIPAGLIAFGRWRWTPILAVVAGVFLIFGLFASGESNHLFVPESIGDAVGLWIQTLTVIVATVAAVIAIVQNYRSGASGSENSPE